MRALYNPIMEEYSQMCEEINELMLDTALEAEETATKPTGSDSINKASFATQDTVSKNESVKKVTNQNSFIAKIKRFLEKIAQIIDKFTSNIKNRTRIIMETTNGFRKNYEKDKRVIKPNEAVKVICYEYGDTPMKTIDRILVDFLDCILYLGNVDANVRASARVADILDEGGNLFEKMYSKYAPNSKEPIKNASSLYKYLLEDFRGEKKERTFKSSSIPILEKICFSTDYVSKTNLQLTKISTAYQSTKSKVTSYMRGNIEEEEKKRLNSNINKISQMYNDITYLIKMNCEAMLEMSLSSRAILKRFYNM